MQKEYAQTAIIGSNANQSEICADACTRPST